LIKSDLPALGACAANRVMEPGVREQALVGARVERVPDPTGFGGRLSAGFPRPAGGLAPAIQMATHVDSLHSVGTLAQRPRSREGVRAPAIGLAIAHPSSGRRSDGDCTGAMGVPRAGAYTLKEHFALRSPPQRAGSAAALT
jgi:hypothetical protein